MITMTMRLTVDQKAREDVLRTLRSLVGPISIQKGCRSCRILQDVENLESIMLLEVWDSQSELERHICSADYKTILAIMEVASEPPELRFDKLAYQGGFDLVEKLRRANH